VFDAWAKESRNMTRILTPFLLAALLLPPAMIGSVSAAPLATDEVLPTSPEDDATKKEYKEIKDAAAKFQARDFEGALTLLDQAHAKYPELPPGQLILAQFFLQAAKGTGGQAQNQLLALFRNNLEQTVSKHPGDPEAYLFLGDMAFAQGRVTEAELLFQKADTLNQAMDAADVRKADLHKRCLAGNATIFEARGNLPEAVKLLTEFATAAPDNPIAHYRLGQVQFKNKEARSAFDSFKKAVGLKAEMGPAGLIMARLFEQQANVPPGNAAAKKSADDWIAYSLKQGEKDPAAQLGVARLYWDRDDVANAKKHAQTALQLSPDSRDAKLILGLIARYEKDLPGAEKTFEEIYKLDPANFAAANQFVITLVDQEDESKKGRALAVAEANWKDHQATSAAPTAAATLGWVYYRLGRSDDAQKMLNVALQAGRGNISGDTAYYVAKLYADNNKPEEAKKLLEDTLKGKGPFPYRAECQALLDQVSSATPTPATTNP
jgi:tetratricopeptide (TPR) repeat protein